MRDRAVLFPCLTTTKPDSERIVYHQVASRRAFLKSNSALISTVVQMSAAWARREAGRKNVRAMALAATAEVCQGS